MGTIAVHEFISLDGVFENPTWTFDYEFDPKMGNVIAKVMGACDAILLGHTTFEMFAPAWSPRTAAEDPGAPFMNDSPKYVVASTPVRRGRGRACDQLPRQERAREPPPPAPNARPPHATPRRSRRNRGGHRPVPADPILDVHVTSTTIYISGCLQRS